MKKEQAYATLGIEPDGDYETAFKTLMRTNHPDMGGSTAVAQLISEAYEFLRSGRSDDIDYTPGAEAEAESGASAPEATSTQPESRSDADSDPQPENTASATRVVGTIALGGIAIVLLAVWTVVRLAFRFLGGPAVMAATVMGALALMSVASTMQVDRLLSPAAQGGVAFMALLCGLASLIPGSFGALLKLAAAALGFVFPVVWATGAAHGHAGLVVGDYGWALVSLLALGVGTFRLGWWFLLAAF